MWSWPPTGFALARSDNTSTHDKDEDREQDSWKWPVFFRRDRTHEAFGSTYARWHDYMLPPTRTVNMSSDDLLLKLLHQLSGSKRSQALQTLEDLRSCLEGDGTLPAGLANDLLSALPEDEEIEIYDCVACQLPTTSLRTREEYVRLEIGVKKWLGSVKRTNFPVPVCTDCWGSE